MSVRAEEAEQMRKRSLSLAIAGTLAIGFVPFAASVARAQTSLELCFLSSINAERAHAGRPKLVSKTDLVSVARRHSAHMAADGTIYHNRNLGNEVGGNWWALGENVGMGPTCDSLNEAFMASPGHRSNILDRDYNQSGVGVAVRDGTIYVTEIFAGRSGGSSIAHRPTKPPKASLRAVLRAQSAEPLTVPILLTMLGMDAARVDPATGEALGV